MSVAVAVTRPPGTIVTGSVTSKDPLPLPSVGTDADPRNVSPSPCPEGSQRRVEKNCTVKLLVGELQLLERHDVNVEIAEALKRVLPDKERA